VEEDHHGKEGGRSKQVIQPLAPSTTTSVCLCMESGPFKFVNKAQSQYQ
jgi:hypothetical protein